MTTRRRLTAAAALAAALALTGCQSTNVQPTPDNPYALREKGHLTVCADMPYAPFEFQDEQRHIVGFDMDLADAIAESMGVTKDVIVTPFEQIQSASALNAADCDVAISSITMTDARKTKMDFSKPYYDDNLGLMAASKSGIKDLASAKGRRIGVVAGTTGADFAKEKKVNATIFKDTGTLIQGLKSGQIEAAIGNKSVLGYTRGGDSRFAFVEEYETGEQLGVAVKKGNTRMQKKVNEALQEYVRSGRMEQAKKKWFAAAD